MKNDETPPPAVADLHGKILDAPSRSNILHFHAIFRKIWPNNRWPSPPLGFAPHLENPGSATDQTKTKVELI